MKNLSALQILLTSTIKAEGVQKIPGFGLCIFKRELDLVKLLRLNIRRRLGAEVIYADVAILSESDFHSSDQKKTPGVEHWPPSLTVCPLMNFPDLMKHAYIIDGLPTQKWIKMIAVLFGSLPENMASVRELFDGDFADLEPIDRVPSFVSYLRSSVDLEDL